MAQDGPHDHPDTTSDGERSLAPLATMTSTQSPGENNSGSRTYSSEDMDASKGKDIVPNAIQGEELGSAITSNDNADKSKGKSPTMSIAAAGDGLPTGKNSLASDDGEVKVHIIMERERRRRMKDMFSSLHALMPHIPEKVDMATLVGETINYIRALEQTKAELEKRKQEQVLARQAAAEAAAFSLLAPHAAQGMVSRSGSSCPAPPHQPTTAATSALPPLTAAAGPVGFQTWSAPNIVLSVTNNEAIINVCAPRQPRMLTLVLSVLNRHGIDVITTQVEADSARGFFTFYTRVNGAGGNNQLAEDIYKLAVSEIMVWLSK